MIRFWDNSGISWIICKQCAPRSRQTITPIPHHSIFTGEMLFLMPKQQCQSTEDKFSGKFATNSYLHIPPDIKYVATYTHTQV